MTKIPGNIPAIKECSIGPIKEVYGPIKVGSYARKRPRGSTGWTSLMYMTLLLLTFCLQAQAQQSDGYLLKKNQFSVGIGVGYFKMVDFQFSPNLYQSVRKNLQLGYSNRWKKGIFSTKLNVFFGGLTLNSGSELNFYLQETDIYGVETINQEEIKLSQLGLNVELGYLHKLSKLASSNTMLYLGGSLEECLIYTPGFLSMGTINYGSLNAKARFDYFLGNGKPIILGLSFPIVSMVTRLPYHNAPNYPGKSGIQGFFTDNNNIETLGHFQNFRFSAKYNWLVTGLSQAKNFEF